MKIETSWLYLSIDRDGFMLEIGNIDEGTSMFTLNFMRNWCPPCWKGSWNSMENCDECMERCPLKKVKNA